MNEVRTLSQLLDKLSHGYIISNGSLVQPYFQKPVLVDDRVEYGFCINIAGHVFEIHTKSREVRTMCENYISESAPEFQFSVSDSDLDFERSREIESNTIQTDDHLEKLSLLRKTSETMLSFDTFLVHGAVIAVNGEAYMFTAESGTGKTTHIKKWLENLKDAYVVNGDKPLIHITESQAVACGTPWCGKEGMGTNSMVPLKAIVLMERGENNLIEEITFGKAFIPLLGQMYRPGNQELMSKSLHLLSMLKDKVRFYRFVFNNMKEDAFSVPYYALIGEGKK